MALKDWKKTVYSENQLRWDNIKTGHHLHLALTKDTVEFKEQYNIKKQYVVWVASTWDYITGAKDFDTHTAALAFAKSYMGSH
jgi:hypothetical protein